MRWATDFVNSDTYMDGVAFVVLIGLVTFAACALLWCMFSSPRETHERAVLARWSLGGLVVAAFVSWIWFAVVPIAAVVGLAYLLYRLVRDAFSKN